MRATIAKDYGNHRFFPRPGEHFVGPFVWSSRGIHRRHSSRDHYRDHVRKLREQIQEMADTLVALGIQPGDRVATSLTNGLPAIVSFVAASVAGTAAPLNPGYRQDEVNFYLEDTSAKLLLAPAEGMDDARKAAAERNVPVYTLEMDESG